jgi:hypothetical protein
MQFVAKPRIIDKIISVGNIIPTCILRRIYICQEKHRES